MRSLLAAHTNLCLPFRDFDLGNAQHPYRKNVNNFLYYLWVDPGDDTVLLTYSESTVWIISWGDSKFCRCLIQRNDGIYPSERDADCLRDIATYCQLSKKEKWCIIMQKWRLNEQFEIKCWSLLSRPHIYVAAKVDILLCRRESIRHPKTSF
jgi:hypothetical protein